MAWSRLLAWCAGRRWGATAADMTRVGRARKSTDRGSLEAMVTKIAIAGAGIGGLTAACCLLNAGHNVEVFEQAPELGEIGAGIQLSANAMHVLNDLGLSDAIAR